MYRGNYRPSPMSRHSGGNRMGMDNGNWGRRDMPMRNDGCGKEKNDFMRRENDCGCEKDRNEPQRRENDCGCEKDRNEPQRRENDCGCERERNESQRRENDCGCERDRNESQRRDNDCGCERERNEARRREDGCGCEQEKREERDVCECKPSVNDQLAGMALVMAYVPWQDYRDIACEADGWECGTIFRQLDFDFQARRCN